LLRITVIVPPSVDNPPPSNMLALLLAMVLPVIVFGLRDDQSTSLSKNRHGISLWEDHRKNISGFRQIKPTPWR